MKTTTLIRKDKSKELHVVGGSIVYTNGNGKYSVSQTPNIRMVIRYRLGCTSEENMDWLKRKVESKLNVQCQWVDGPMVEYIPL